MDRQGHRVMVGMATLVGVGEHSRRLELVDQLSAAPAQGRHLVGDVLIA